MTQQMMAELFQTTVPNVNVHIKNILQEDELQQDGTIKEILIVRTEGRRQVRRPVNFYSLDMILSVGYRVNTRRGTQFRIWATQRLREYLLRGYVVHEKRMQQLGQVVKLMRRAADRLYARQVLDVIEHYSNGLNLLDAYDHQCLTRPQGSKQCYVLGYDECRLLYFAVKNHGFYDGNKRIAAAVFLYGTSNKSTAR